MSGPGPIVPFTFDGLFGGGSAWERRIDVDKQLRGKARMLRILMDAYMGATGSLGIANITSSVGELADALVKAGLTVVPTARLLRVLRKSREQTHKARQERDLALALLADIVDFDGFSHDDPECPEDDTCRCENAGAVNEALAKRASKVPGHEGRRQSAARAENWRRRIDDERAKVSAPFERMSEQIAAWAEENRRRFDELRRHVERSADAHRWWEHVASCVASGREPTAVMAYQEGRADCVYYRPGKPSGDCGGDGHFMCDVCAKRTGKAT